MTEHGERQIPTVKGCSLFLAHEKTGPIIRTVPELETRMRMASHLNRRSNRKIKGHS